MSTSGYFYEAGAVQQSTPNGPVRVIEGEHSALDAKKIPQDLCIKITHALNFFDDGYMPSDDDLAEVEKHANEMVNGSVYGGGIILNLVHYCRLFKELKAKYEKKLI